MYEHGKMPPEIASAVIQVMGEIHTLEKGERNQHGKYDFTSIDDFLSAVRPLCAKAGIAFQLNEESTEIVSDYSQKAAYLKVTYRVGILHKSGVVADGGQRHAYVMAAGAQAMGSAQSYTLKQYLRGLFQIATGDKDDADCQAATPISAKTDRLNFNITPWKARIAKIATGEELDKLIGEMAVARDAGEIPSAGAAYNALRQAIYNKRRDIFPPESGAEVDATA